MSRRKIAILGCGPSGLMAAHIATLAGDQATIFSHMAPSALYGCQYLHAPIPSFSMAAPVVVSYDRIGTDAEYRRKVYGENWNGLVSTQTLTREHAAWDIRESYKRMWDMYSPSIVHTHIDDVWLKEFTGDRGTSGFDYVFSSVPAPVLCKGVQHNFRSMSIYALGETPTRKIEMDDFAIGGNHILCNGLDNPRWYRVSNVFGYATVEWPTWKGPPEVKGYSTVAKPLGHDCDCYPGIIRIGRYGRWEKGILTHHSMDQVWEVLR